VDAVSSLGSVEIRMDDWGIDFLASSSQKCLGAPPGLAPCAVGKNGGEIVETIKDQPHGWYCNLRTWRNYEKEWGDWQPYPGDHVKQQLNCFEGWFGSVGSEGC